MTVALAMIARDAEATIGLTLGSVRELVDSYVVVDTGSVDSTCEIVRETMKDLPGELAHRDWVNFAHNRTELLALARERADYALVVDADMFVSEEGERPSFESDAYRLRIVDGSLTWRLPLLVSSKKPFHYQGAAHAHLACAEAYVVSDSNWLVYEGGKGASREKLKRDVELLLDEWAEKPSSRTAFYLARTFDDLDVFGEAIVWYRRRITMGGWDQELYYSRFRLGCLLSKHVSFADGARELLAAWNGQRDRAEALRALARAADSVADKLVEPEGLFVHSDAYGGNP